MWTEFLVVGNITKDLIRTRGKEEFSFGGTSYSGLAAAQLGYKSSILSRGNDGLSEWIGFLKGKKIYVDLQPDENMTFFLNDYTHGEREQLLLSTTDSIEFYNGGRKNVISINPMFGEVDYKLVKKARECCDVLSLDVQGFVRDSKDKRVVGKLWQEREDFLPFVDVLKIGKAEVGFVSKHSGYRDACKELYELGAKIVTLTFGEEGSLVYDGKFYEVPVFKTNVVDETGAGDVYGTAFAIRYFETEDSLDSAIFATAAASFVVEDFGPRSIAKRNDVENRYDILKEQLHSLYL